MATTVEIFSIPASTTWRVPLGATNVVFECWGAGGAGSNNDPAFTHGGNLLLANAGGGGGAYANKTITNPITGDLYTLIVGEGGDFNASEAVNPTGNRTATVSTVTNPSSTIICKGDYGRNGNANTWSGGVGGSTANSIGDTKFAGGNGGAGGAGGVHGGGGGGGAGDGTGPVGTTGTGSNGSSVITGLGGAGGVVNPDPIFGGTGGAGATNINLSGSAGNRVGGGGGGAGGYSGGPAGGGPGADGYIRVTTTIIKAGRSAGGGATYNHPLIY